MALWRKAGLVLLTGAMTAVMVAAWGSIGSVVMAFGLLLVGSALLYQRFLVRDDPDDRDYYE